MDSHSQTSLKFLQPGLLFIENKCRGCQRGSLFIRLFSKPGGTRLGDGHPALVFIMVTAAQVDTMRHSAGAVFRVCPIVFSRLGHL
jgi:hypothetical protein